MTVSSISKTCRFLVYAVPGKYVPEAKYHVTIAYLMP